MGMTLKELLTKGEGTLTAGEAKTLASQCRMDVETLYTLLEERGIKILDDEADGDTSLDVEGIMAEVESAEANSDELGLGDENEDDPAEENPADLKAAMDELLDDPVKNYLKQIGQIPLLSAEQEVDLSKRIHAGAEAAHILQADRQKYGAPEYIKKNSARFSFEEDENSRSYTEDLDEDGNTKSSEDDEEKAAEEEELVDPNELVDSFSTDDPVRMYLKEIGKVPLLSAEGEVELASTISAGNKAKATLMAWERANGQTVEPVLDAEDPVGEIEISDEEVANLTEEDLAQLRKAVKAGETAKQKLAEANLRLVVSIAKRYAGRGMLFLDLIQEGNLGLIKAVEKFDYTKGYKFSTYATWWIRQAITRAIADQARTIRIPVHMVETINKVIRVSRQLLQELGHDPSPEEISAQMNMPVDKVREILKIAQEPVSLETPIGEEEDSHLGDFIPDEGASEPSEAASFTLLKEQLVDVLSTLTPREEKVLKLRFGIEDGRTRTLEEVGKEFNVTRERIRQIEAKALRKLRHPSRSKKLKDFLN